jgi:hypothetical protein
MRAEVTQALGRWGLTREVLASAAVGLVLVGLGTPRLIASTVLPPGSPASREPAVARPPASDDLGDLAARLSASLHWVRSGLALKQLGLAELALAEGAAAGSASPEELRRAARQHLAAGLAVAPADPVAWSGLASVSLAEGGATEAAARALVLSLLTGPHEPAIFWQRLDLCLALWPAVAESDRSLVLEQLRQAWAAAPEKLAALARQRDAAAAVRTALATQPAALKRFDAMIARPGQSG